MTQGIQEKLAGVVYILYEMSSENDGMQMSKIYDILILLTELQEELKPKAVDEQKVGEAIVREAWAIEGIPIKSVVLHTRLLGRAAIAEIERQKQ